MDYEGIAHMNGGQGEKEFRRERNGMRKIADFDRFSFVLFLNLEFIQLGKRN